MFKKIQKKFGRASQAVRPELLGSFAVAAMDMPDAWPQALLGIVEQEFGGALDMVMDDASHIYEPTLASFQILFTLLPEGGLYIIEDWAWNTDRISFAYSPLGPVPVANALGVRADRSHRNAPKADHVGRGLPWNCYRRTRAGTGIACLPASACRPDRAQTVQFCTTRTGVRRRECGRTAIVC